MTDPGSLIELPWQAGDSNLGLLFPSLTTTVLQLEVLRSLIPFVAD